MNYEEEYNKEVARILRVDHKISWIKAIQVFGYDKLHQFYVAGNLCDRTADAIATMVKRLRYKLYDTLNSKTIHIYKSRASASRRRFKEIMQRNLLNNAIVIEEIYVDH